MDMDEDEDMSLFLGRPFMKTVKVIIDVDDRKMKVRSQDDEVTLDVSESPKEC